MLPRHAESILYAFSRRRTVHCSVRRHNQYPQAFILLTHLSRLGVEQIEHTVEDHWMNAHVPPIPTPQHNNVISATLYGTNEPERPSARALLLK